jgi:NADPH-dependent glutamate synthase beta subunit-like oxidoreductase
MNGPIPPIWTTGSTEVFKTGSWRATAPRHIRAPSPCHAACPVNGDIAEWIGLARARDFRGAWEALTRHNPFPAIAGRICHHPCETACNRAGFDEAISICKLERFVGDAALAEGWSFAPPDVERGEKIAVVGGGPSGLSAAYQLRRQGYRVTLFEAQPALGGLMRDGIPPYRLARAVLDGEIARIVALGIDVRCNEALAAPGDLQRLRERFDAVYLATGARRHKRLPQLDYAQPWVLDGAAYLAQASLGASPALGRRVVVIGGGSAAFDVARSARRAGHEVTLVALESAKQLPAQREEIEEALEEGIVLVTGSMLTAARLVADGIRLELSRVRFEPGAQRGRFTVTPLADSDFALMADAVVPSIGQDPDLSALGLLAADGNLLRVDATQATSEPRVFAGGDLASMARFVTEAIGMGKRAAWQIDRVLRGAGDEAPVGEAIVPLAAIATAYYDRQPRAEAARLAPTQRLAGDAEVQLGFDVEAALAETTRCFSCGTCVLCDNCVNVCPDLAVKREGAGYVVLGDYCKGCGLCVKECPTGSMKMVEEAR